MSPQSVNPNQNRNATEPPIHQADYTTTDGIPQTVNVQTETIHLQQLVIVKRSTGQHNCTSITNISRLSTNNFVNLLTYLGYTLCTIQISTSLLVLLRSYIVTFVHSFLLQIWKCLLVSTVFAISCIYLFIQTYLIKFNIVFCPCFS